MDEMTTFDSFTLIPSYSDILSRSEVDVSTEICGIRSDLPIINANMLAICSKEMVNVLNDNNTFSSYHRFFNSIDNRFKSIFELKEYKNRLFISIGTKKEEYDYVSFLYDNGFDKVIIDVNHGHHLMVKNMIQHIKSNIKNMIVMAGNVSSVEGVMFLEDAGADCIKVGNSFGSVCSTMKATSFGAHPLHIAKKCREKNCNIKLCLDGGIRTVGDIAKSLIWGDCVMLGRMFAGTDESFEKLLHTNEGAVKEYYGNASIKTKCVVDDENHVRNIEGFTSLVPCIGPLKNVLKNIKEGIQSAFSFVGARNLGEYKAKCEGQVLYI